MTPHEHHQKTPPLQVTAEIIGAAAIFALLASVACFEIVDKTEIMTGVRPDALYFWADAATGFGIVAMVAAVLTVVLQNAWKPITRWINGRIPGRRAVELFAAAVVGLVMALAGWVGTVAARRSAEHLGETGTLISSTAPLLTWMGATIAVWAVASGVAALLRGTPRKPLAQ